MTQAAIERQATETTGRGAANVGTPIAARAWTDASARALGALLDWVEASADPLVAVDRAGRIAIANAAFARVFAVAPQATRGLAGDADSPALARFVPLLTPPRLARWTEESANLPGAAPRVHRLLAECVGGDGDAFLAAVTLLRAGDARGVSSPTDLACVVSLRPLDAPRGLRGVPFEPGAAFDAGTGAADQDAVDLGALLDAALRALPAADARRRCRLAASAIELRLAVDPGPVLEALVRVIDNGCRYSTPDTAVQLRTRVEPADPADGPDAVPYAVVTIADRGRGLSRAHLQRAFEPFWRAPAAVGEPGHGLGLAIARHLVEGQRGWVEMRSMLGVGTEVDVWLPTARA